MFLGVSVNIATGRGADRDAVFYTCGSQVPTVCLQMRRKVTSTELARQQCEPRSTVRVHELGHEAMEAGGGIERATEAPLATNAPAARHGKCEHRGLSHYLEGKLGVVGTLLS